MKKVIVMASAIMFLAACTKDNNSGLMKESNLSQNQKGGKAVTRPMKVDLVSSEDPNSSIPPTPCTGDLGLANAGYFMHGNATHLGQLISSNSRGQDTKCDFRFSTGLLNTEVKGQLAAANGDLIYYTGVDVLDLNSLFIGGTEGTIKGRWTITGGTGRFAGATGYFDISGPVYFTPPAYFSITGEGVITY
jgi:hypothetical protein